MTTRRSFLKNSIILSSASYLMPTSISLLNANENIQWNETICPFCSIGCKVNISNIVTPNKKSYINKGMLCTKAEYLLDINNNKQRLSSPLLKMKNGKYDKDGTFSEISWLEAFDIMEEKAKKSLKKSGVNGVGLFTGGNASIYDGYAINKLFKAGFRSNNISNSSSYSTQVASNALNMVYGTNSPNCSFDDIEQTDVFVSWGTNLAETYPIVYQRILTTKDKKKSQFKTINITTIKNNTSKGFDLDILIKPNTDLILLKYIQREYLYYNKKKINWDYLKSNTIFATKDEINHDKQWEISFYEFKKSILKYDLDYVANGIKAIEDEDINDFKRKLKDLANYYINQNIVSFWSSGINKQKTALDTNITLHSLHLLLDKHSKKGNGAMSLAGQTSAQGTSVEVGTFSDTLPANMFLKYKEHRVKTEQLWQLPAETLNPVSNKSYFTLYENIKNKLTTFIWINNANPFVSAPYKYKIKDFKDTFIVTSDIFMSYSASMSDLILPSCTSLEKNGAFGNSERKTQTFKQIKEPYGKSMSDLWQCVEFSKRFDIGTVWQKSEVQGNQYIPSVKYTARKMGYRMSTNLFEILFASSLAKSNSIDNTNDLNTEANADKREIKIHKFYNFEGYGFNIQKYLYEEYRKFTFGTSYDLISFDSVLNKSKVQWPILFNLGTQYRFNNRYDSYAKRASKQDNSKYKFYGKLGDKNLKYGNFKEITKDIKYSSKNKAKIFTTKNTLEDEVPPKNFSFLLTSVRLLDSYNTKTLTSKVANVDRNTYCYINKDVAKQLGVKDNEIVKIITAKDEQKVRLKINDRFDVPKNILALTSFSIEITTKINDTLARIEKI